MTEDSASGRQRSSVSTGGVQPSKNMSVATRHNYQRDWVSRKRLARSTDGKDVRGGGEYHRPSQIAQVRIRVSKRQRQWMQKELGSDYIRRKKAASVGKAFPLAWVLTDGVASGQKLKLSVAQDAT